MRPGQFLRETLQSLRLSRLVATRFLVRDMRSQYRQSVLGYLWIVAPPLATALLWVLLNASGIINVGDTGVPYPVFALVGTLLFQGFIDGLDAPLNQLDAGAGLLGKVSFPVESLLLAGVLRAAINAVIRLAVSLPVVLAFGVRPGWTLLLAPFGSFTLVFLGLGVGLALAPVGALYRDVPQAVGFFRTFLFLVTPVVYAPIQSGIGNVLYRVNPVAQLLTVARDWTVGGPTLPSPLWYAVLAGTVGLVVVAWLFFRLSLPHLVDRLST